MKSEVVPAGTVVVGVDRGPALEETVAWAVEEAFLDGRDLTLAHVVRDELLAAMSGTGLALAPAPDPERAAGEEILQRARSIAEQRVAVLAARRFQGHRRPQVRAVARAGDPRRVLLAASHDAAVLILGSHGRGAVRSVVLGSVGRGVVAEAGCPVMVLRPRHAGGVRRGVLVGVDATERSLPVLEFAFRQAARRDLPLTTLYCFEDLVSEYAGPGPMRSDEDGYEERRLTVAESVAGLRERYPDVHPHLRIARGRPEDVLAAYAETMHLVVMGAPPSSRLARVFLGDVARSVLARAHAVVAVVPTGAQAPAPGEGHAAEGVRGR